jgi:hypothetical protein
MQDNIGDARAVQSDQCGVTPGAPMPRRTSEPGMLGLGRLTLAFSGASAGSAKREEHAEQ